MPAWSSVAATLRGVERWLLPSECLLCRRPIAATAPDSLVCALCRARWLPLPEPVCPRCGQPISLGLECRICETWPPRFGPARSAVWLTGGARGAVHHLKYGGWWRVAAAMAEAMLALEPLRGGDLLVPVPLGTARLRERGYNQCGFLAQALGARSGSPVRPNLLRRVRETERQTELAPEARRANVTGAFAAEAIPDRAVVLVDDVFTTGATLAAAAEALLAAGAPAVRAVTFARARRPLDDDVAAFHSTST